MIKADRKDYRNGFHKHYSTCKGISPQSAYSKKLLLFYSVESGLKYLLMEKWGIMNQDQIKDNKEKLDLLHTHNINAILKELGQQGTVKFPIIKTNHNDQVDITAYHQICRYGIKVDNKDREKEKIIEKGLKKIADWIMIERM